MDRLTAAKRSWLMSRVPSKNTVAELRVRAVAHRIGFRFRLHRKDLPGTPDIVLPKHRTVIFVHGCFWHRHPNCKKASTPKTRTAFWNAKFARNVERDAQKAEQLRLAGWQVETIWECDTKSPERIEQLLRGMLPGSG